MNLRVSERDLKFVPVRLDFQKRALVNLFAQKNNKTVAETIDSKGYADLSVEVRQNYPQSLNEPVGLFLFCLKSHEDPFYRCFLNKYGDKSYCEFSISSPVDGKLKGLYCFTIGDDIQYIGRSHDPFEKRLNQGYGHISPKNCYRDGQSTNCHLNSLIAETQVNVAFFICPLTDNKDIDDLEKQLIKQLDPAWNTA